MYKRLKITHLAIFSMLCLLIAFQASTVFSETSGQAEAKYRLNDVTTDLTDNSITIVLSGSSAPAFTSRELYDPYRLVVDITDVSFAEKLKIDRLITKNKFVSLKTTVVKGLKPEITRFIFTIKDGYRQKVKRDINDLVITITPISDVADKKSGKSKPMNGKKEVDSNAIISDLIDSSTNSSNGKKTSSGKVASEDLANSFDFSGYKRQRISVDFYKIDLHNVFRLIRQVSGLNVIIDEKVTGSITLALNDVPWDYALDVIINLAELEKEERFNTIVIYPRNKDIEWPKHNQDNLTFEANLEVVEQEALIIEQSANQSKEVMAAKELMRKGRIEEKNNDFEDAVDLYLQAIELWPSNGRLHTRIAALYLVHLRMNSKGLFYAKKALSLDNKNYMAALYTAIGMANMNRNTEAIEYFSQSISGTPPMKEALASFAAFSETNGRYNAALKLYKKYDAVYGENVNSMISKARIYDALGMTEKAVAQYEAVIASGFQIAPDLKKYINSRLSEMTK